ncbi:hypothetical protein [Streptomyces montanisoli]|uniref:Uncharacterized protein n=1 Tax=Streptomyces montanisoli TaxID=2798581 RepID=A0A940M834_9ACTN|nr:hypothetical protein [Streptomyces montanisoli]MBP0456032.1 hypothetical protein [Streptomyces montanisoli]
MILAPEHWPKPRTTGRSPAPPAEATAKELPPLRRAVRRLDVDALGHGITSSSRRAAGASVPRV